MNFQGLEVVEQQLLPDTVKDENGNVRPLDYCVVRMEGRDVIVVKDLNKFKASIEGTNR